MAVLMPVSETSVLGEINMVILICKAEPAQLRGK